MCGGTTGDTIKFVQGMGKDLQKGQVSKAIKRSFQGALNPFGVASGWADVQHGEQKTLDEKNALAEAASEEEFSKTESYSLDNSGFGVGDPKKKKKRHGMSENILTSSQGLV